MPTSSRKWRKDVLSSVQILANTNKLFIRSVKPLPCVIPLGGHFPLPGKNFGDVYSDITVHKITILLGGHFVLWPSEWIHSFLDIPVSSVVVKLNSWVFTSECRWPCLIVWYNVVLSRCAEGPWNVVIVEMSVEGDDFVENQNEFHQWAFERVSTLS